MPPYIRHRLRWSALVALCVLCVPVAASAQAGGVFPVDTTYQTISNWTLVAVQFVNMLTWFVFSFLVKLLDPRFIFDDGLMNVLNLIWRLARNLMNVAFAVALIGAAIYTVVTANKEFVSAHMKNFILCVVLVNFSWFIPRVLIDIANVATATIFSIPTAIQNEDPNAQCRYISTTDRECFDAQPADGGFSCACKAVADFAPFPGSDKSKDLLAINFADSKETWQCNIAYCIRYVKLDPGKSTAEGTILNGLVVNHARLPQLATITRTKADGDIADLLLFILRELVVLVIHVALFFPLAALLIALVIRIPILWLTVAFMPFYCLKWVLPDMPGASVIKEKADMIGSLFLKAAFLPAAVAIPLTIGFIMANAGTHIPMAGLDGIEFTLIDGMGSMAQLLWVVMVLAILWSGTFMVLEAMTSGMPGASVIQGMKSYGEQAGQFAAKLPLSQIPLPVPGGSALSAARLLNPRRWNAALDHPQGIAAGMAAQATASAPDRNATAAAAKTIADDGSGAKQRKLVEAIDKFSSNPTFITHRDDLIKALKETNRGMTVNDGNFDSVVREISRTLKDVHHKDLLNSTQLQNFTDAVTRLRAPSTGSGAAPATSHP